MISTRAIGIPVGPHLLEADLALPDGARALIILAFEARTRRQSLESRLLANELNKTGFATLLTDLLSPAEEMALAAIRHNRPHIEQLDERLEGITTWLERDPVLGTLRYGYCVSDCSAAAGLLAAAELPLLVEAVVTCGGPVELAVPGAEAVEAPTLLIADPEVQELLGGTEETFDRLRAVKLLKSVPGATLLSSRTALSHVASLACGWFQGYLVDAPARRELVSPDVLAEDAEAS